MNAAATWWYMDQLKRKRAQLEGDHQRVSNLLTRPHDRQTELRLKRELEDIEIRLGKIRRGLLY